MIKSEINPNLLNKFLDYSLIYQRKSQESIVQYNSDLVMFLRYTKHLFKQVPAGIEFNEIKINDINEEYLSRITKDDIHSFISYITLKRNCSATTAARKISTIRIFFKYLCLTINVLAINPAQNLETPKLQKRLPKYLSLEESTNLLKTANEAKSKNPERDFAIVTLFLNSGLRLSELVSINIKDIKFDESLMTVVGKGNKERTIYLNKPCIQALRDYLAVRNTNPKHDDKLSEKALFLSSQRQRISKRTVENIVKNLIERSGLDSTKYSTHKLRHTAATLMYKYGQVDIRSLQELLGHECISTTEIYTHVDNDQIRSAIENNPLSSFKTTE